MDYVTIEGLTAHGAHGHYPEERTREQAFELSLRLGTDLRRAGQSDSLIDTIDYDVVKRIIDETFARESRYLIESLAEEIAERILRQTPAREVTISIQKKEVWENGVPGIVITRRA
jgi:7,8-dihydroneopterin aldolase/epimerase/oxygenase